MNDYQKARKEIKRLHKEASGLAKTTLLEGLDKLFKKHPEVGGVTWTQYTPSFNDGDPCTFRSNHCYADLLGTEEVDCDDEDEDSRIGQDITEEARDVFEEFLAQFEDEDMETLFGDGVRVTIDRKLKIRESEYYD
jgi:hypothetical protein